MHSTRPTATSHGLSIVDLLDQVRSEHEAAVQQLAVAKMEQREAERKHQAQLVEMQQIRQVLHALETTHRRLRQQYEDELLALRQQLQVGVPAKRLSSLAEAGEAGARVKEPKLASPVQVAPVVSAARSLGQLGQPTSTALPSMGFVQPMQQPAPPLLRPLNGTPVKRRTSPIPTIAVVDVKSKRSEERVETGGPLSIRSSPVTKKPKTLVSSSPSLPVPPSMPKDDAKGPEGEASRSDTPLSSSSSEHVTKAAQIRHMASSKSVSSTSSERNESAKNAKGNKLNWICAYSNDSSPQRYTNERPIIELRHTLDHRSIVCCVRFSPDGKTLATGCYKTARVFDVDSGEEKFIMNSSSKDNGREDDSGHVRAIAFSPDSKKLAVGMPQSAVRVYDVATNEGGPVLSGHDSDIYALDWSNNLIVSGSGDKKIRLWDARTGNCTKVIGSESRGPSDGVTSVVFSPDGRYLAASSLDKVVRVWDTESSQLVDRFEGHSDSVYSIAFSADGKQLVSGSFDKTIMLWDVNAQGRTSARPRMVLQGHKDFVLSVAYAPDGRLMSGSKDRSIVFWDLRSSRSLLTLTGFRNSVIGVASSPASSLFATGSGDCLATVWNYKAQA